MTTIKYITATELIKVRDKIIKDLKNSWKTIKTFNVIDKDYELPKDIDLKKTYERISELEACLISIKLALQAINMGLTSFKDLPENNVYTSIFTLCQIKERKTNLSLIPLNLKNTKVKTKTHFDASFIKKEIEVLYEEQRIIEKELEDFNNDHKFINDFIDLKTLQTI